jgi:hypothetical protein
VFEGEIGEEPIVLRGGQVQEAVPEALRIGLHGQPWIGPKHRSDKVEVVGVGGLEEGTGARVSRLHWALRS